MPELEKYPSFDREQLKVFLMLIVQGEASSCPTPVYSSYPSMEYQWNMETSFLSPDPEGSNVHMSKSRHRGIAGTWTHRLPINWQAGHMLG